MEAFVSSNGSNITGNLSDGLAAIDSQTSGGGPDPMEALEQSLEFRFFEGRETVHVFPHTTGWRVLPFSVFTCVLDGGGSLHVEGRADVNLGPGDVFLVPTHVGYQSDTLHAGGMRVLWMHFAFRLLGGIDLFSLVHVPGRIPAPKAQEGREALRQIIDLYAASDDHPLTLLARRRQAVSRFLSFLLDVCPARSNVMELIGLSQRLQPALAHIHQHYAERIDRDDLARLTCLARSRFHHLFHQLTGMGVMEYLKHLRIQRAKVLLLATDQPIGDVAAAIGYADPSHFSRLFTALVGCSPRSFRNRSTGIGKTEAADQQTTPSTVLHTGATQAEHTSECLIIYLRSQRAAG